MNDERARLFARRRRDMVALIEKRGVRARAVLAAMEAVAREDFVPPHLAELAYDDGALPIGEGQTISQPYIVALMSEAAEIGEGRRVLDVGTGSGYSAAVMAAAGARVFSIERYEALVETARRRLAEAGYGDVAVKTGDGTVGWPEKGPFDAIVVAAAGPRIPDALRRQLRLGGRLVLPVGGPAGPQTLTCVTRTGEDAFETRALADVAFVPLIGEQGWQR